MSVTALPSSTGETSSISKSSNIFDHTATDDLTTDQIGTRLVGYASQMAALTARFLELLAEFDRRGGWSGEGIMSCAHWLTWRTGLSIRTAQDHLRVAHALPELPLMRQAFAEGRLSYSKVRALTRVATPEREEELLNVALSATASQVERLVRSIRNVDRHRDEPERGTIDSSGSWSWSLDGSLSVNLRLSPLDGARFLAGVVRAEYERTRTAGDPDPATEPAPDQDAPDVTKKSPGHPASADPWRNVPADIAPAVVAMGDTMQAAIGVPEFVPGAELVVHTHDDADPHLDDGPALEDAEVDEAACGGAVRKVKHGKKRKGARGIVLNYGRKRRMPTRKVMRVLFERDRCCQHPGCGRTRHLHAHHVQFWSQDGPTNPDNLILLCSAHHRALHRGEFAIKAHGRQQFSFHRPDGSTIERAPAVHKPEGWQPDTAIDDAAVLPISPGRHLDAGYATEVLYAAWAWKARQSDADLAAA